VTTSTPSTSPFLGDVALDSVEVDDRGISYCNHVSYHLYRFYVAGLAGPNTYLGYARRGVVKWLQLTFPNLTHEQREDAVQRALVSVWDAASRGRLPDGHPSRYARYVIRICQTSVYATLRDKYLKPATSFLGEKGWRGTTATRLASAETIAFIHELPGHLMKLVVEGDRFQDRPEAICYVVRCLWDDDEPDPQTIHSLGVPFDGFFVEHVTLRLRTMLYKLRGTIEVFGKGDDLKMLLAFEAPEE